MVGHHFTEVPLKWNKLGAIPRWYWIDAYDVWMSHTFTQVPSVLLFCVCFVWHYEFNLLWQSSLNKGKANNGKFLWLHCLVEDSLYLQLQCGAKRSDCESLIKGYNHLSFKFQRSDDCLRCFFNGHFILLSNCIFHTHVTIAEIRARQTLRLELETHQREWLDRPLGSLSTPRRRGEPGPESRWTVFWECRSPTLPEVSPPLTTHTRQEMDYYMLARTREHSHKKNPHHTEI